ncbi:MAG: type II restriction endonuclease [Euryarchaeota archaeon]|nr:type II restriction endonuclease [Euryarchaeota archaeon]MBU4492505.1 type II restriction endonuclease [Euryarchaeota archaeon]
MLYTRIKEILKERGYTNIDDILAENNVVTLKHDLKQQINTHFIKQDKLFCTEKYVEGIIKPKDKTPKKFDLIIFGNYKPKYLFEMNFYSTSGTKIGINQGEYVDLNNFMQKNFSDFEFYWITDGNYWLMTDGKNRYLNLLRYFDKIFNINTFEEHLKDFK